MTLRSLALATALALPLLSACAATPAEATTPASVTPPATARAPAPPPTTSAAAAPRWVDELIARLQQEPLTNPPARLLRYQYGGRTVYFLPAKCCDFPSVLFDAEGKKLCNPDGGLTGRGDGQCAGFREARSDEELIWADPRTRERRR